MWTAVLTLVNYNVTHANQSPLETDRWTGTWARKTFKMIYCTMVYQVISWWRYSAACLHTDYQLQEFKMYFKGMKCTTLTLVTGERQCIATHTRLSPDAFAHDPWCSLHIWVWVVELQPPNTPQGQIKCKGQISICSIQVINEVIFYTSTVHSTLARCDCAWGNPGWDLCSRLTVVYVRYINKIPWLRLSP